MSNVISSAIFCARNVDKVENQGKVGRVAPAVGQLWKVGEYTVDKVTKLDNELGRGAQDAVKLLQKTAKEEALLDYAGKAAKFASKYVNPLICVSSGIDVLNSDDKQSALITNVTALSSMFFVEGQMKKVVDEATKQQRLDKLLIAAKDKTLGSKKFGKLTERLLAFAQSHGGTGKWANVAHGVAFVAGSIAAYSIGEKFGSTVAKGVKHMQGGDLEPQNAEVEAQEEQLA